MRDVLLFLTFFLIAPLGLFLPYVGLLVWGWVAMMSPHRLTYGFVYDMRLNLIVAILTILGHIFAQERPHPRFDWSIVLIVAFGFWFLPSTIFSLNTEIAWFNFDNYVKKFVFYVLIFFVVDRRTRIHAFLLLICLCIGFYGVKAGLFTIVTAGAFHVNGPEESEITDNNHFALALAVILPILNYVRMQSRRRGIRGAITVTMLLSVISIIGSYSRGGLIGLAVVFIAMARKLRYGLATIGVASVAAIVASVLMPAQWQERMETIKDPTADSSFSGRSEAWQANFEAALDHPFGVGFKVLESTPALFLRYAHGASKPRAAHSIYFQVLGEHGFVGLALFLGIGVSAFVNIRRIIRLSHGVPRLKWAQDFAEMASAAFFAYFVAGAALSMAYYDVYYVLVVLLAVTRQLAERESRESKVVVQPQPRIGARVTARL